MMSVLVQETGALHSRIIEKRMAAEKSAKVNLFLLIASIMACESFGLRGTKPLTTRGHRGSIGESIARRY